MMAGGITEYFKSLAGLGGYGGNGGCQNVSSLDESLRRRWGGYVRHADIRERKKELEASASGAAAAAVVGAFAAIRTAS